MDGIEFLKDKLFFIVLNGFVSICSAVLLYMVCAELYFMVFIPSIYLVGCVVTLAMEYFTKSTYYKEMFFILESLDNKCLLSEMIEFPKFYEGKLLFRVLKRTNKSMNDEIASYHLSSKEYREYVELWVHEIKTPIAGAKLICENTKNYVVEAELEKIDKFVEQALFYCRSNSVEKDFLIKKICLQDLVNGVLRKNAKYLIENKVAIETKALNQEVLADMKWVEFILEQIINNSVKYQCKKIKIYGQQQENSVSLFIFDDGIGISSHDIGRVFDKGFTGENGRIFAKSTGIGLYLCKKLCIKLGLSIQIQSKQDQGTSLEIIFPKSNMYG